MNSFDEQNEEDFISILLLNKKGRYSGESDRRFGKDFGDLWINEY